MKRVRDMTACLTDAQRAAGRRAVGVLSGGGTSLVAVYGPDPDRPGKVWVSVTKTVGDERVRPNLIDVDDAKEAVMLRGGRWREPVRLEEFATGLGLHVREI